MIMAGELKLQGSPVIKVGSRPTWVEGSHHSSFQAAFQGLTWLDVLRRRYEATGHQAYRTRYIRLLKSWTSKFADIRAPAPRWVWYDMAQGQRAAVFACAIGFLGPRPWLMRAVHLAEQVLKDKKLSRYDGEGNHSLWQDMGLITLARIVSDRRGELQGSSRLRAMLNRSVSPRGESVEGSAAYQALNARWWAEAVTLAGWQGTPLARRVTAMRQVYADLVTPWGSLMGFGDTQSETPAMTRASLPQAHSLSTYPVLGFAQARSATSGSMVLLRYGAAGTNQLHGHADAGSIQFGACGRTLLGDSGMFGYSPTTASGQAARRYVRSAWAHSVVVPTGTSVDPGKRSTLVVRDRGGVIYFQISIPLRDGSRWRRDVVYSRDGAWVLVVDTLAAGGLSLWQLPADSTFVRDGSSIVEQRDAGDCALSITVPDANGLSLVRAGALVGWTSRQFDALDARTVAVGAVTPSDPSAVLVTAGTPTSAGDEDVELTMIGPRSYRIQAGKSLSVVTVRD